MKNIDLTTIEGKNIIFDVSKLFSDEVIYINATKLSLQFEKDLSNYTRSKDYQEYIKVFNSVNFTELELIKTQEGRYGGTYIHSDLIVHFLRWLDIEFAIKCDMYIKKAIQEVHNDKIITTATMQANKANNYWLETRDKGVNVRKELTDAIKTFCSYAEKCRGQKYEKCQYYAHFTNLIYKKLNIAKDIYSNSTRDKNYVATLEKIIELEIKITNWIYEYLEQSIHYKEIYKLIKQKIQDGE